MDFSDDFEILIESQWNLNNIAAITLVIPLLY